MNRPEISGLIRVRAVAILWLAALLLQGCESLPPLPAELQEVKEQAEYRIGPGDNLEIFVWRNKELSANVPVRPDGKLSTPLVEDMAAAGKTPTQLARDMEEVLSTYVKAPVVTVIVKGFNGPFSDQIRVLGEAARPQSLSYREAMTLLDVMIQVGGLTTFADGDRASIVRTVNGEQVQFGVRIADLVKRGDISANVQMLPGDILIIPEALF
ncbi:MAG: XrtA/PEP-CTERM system exopolysaccharide export protein [Gammaproteobacteria bacterium]